MNKINVGQELQKTTPTTFWQRRSVFERDFFNFFIIVGASVAAAVCILFILTGGIAGIVFGVAKILVLFGLNNSIFPGVFSFFASIIGLGLLIVASIIGLLAAPYLLYLLAISPLAWEGSSIGMSGRYK